MDLQEQLLASLKSSVSDAFVTTTSMKPNESDETLLLDEECIICSIGFTGSLEGSFAICLPNSSACKIVSKMLGMDITELTDEIVDGISEQINMVAGGVKMKLEKTPYNFEISIPTTIKGNRMVILSDFSKMSRLTVNYAFDNIYFSVSMLYKLHKDKSDEQKIKEEARAAAFAKLSNLGNLENIGDTKN